MLFALLSTKDACLIQKLFWIAAFFADAAAINPNGTKTLLANVLKVFAIKYKLVFCIGSRSLQRNPPNCTILDSWVFENLKLADKPFEKTLQILETCVLVNNDLCRKLVSPLEPPTTFHENFKVQWVLFFSLDFTLLSC